MKTILIYLKNVKQPFVIEFETQNKLDEFYQALKMDLPTVRVGPLVFAKSEFKYCLQK